MITTNSNMGLRAIELWSNEQESTKLSVSWNQGIIFSPMVWKTILGSCSPTHTSPTTWNLPIPLRPILRTNSYWTLCVSSTERCNASRWRLWRGGWGRHWFWWRWLWRLVIYHYSHQSSSLYAIYVLCSSAYLITDREIN